jgi:hypothetical protein
MLALSLAMLALPARAADVTGKWNFEVDTASGSGSPTFVFKQDGARLTGTYSGAAGEAPVTGTVEGDRIEFSFKASLGGESAVVVYKGTILSATAMKGTAVYPGLGDATWTAAKAAN